MPADRKPAHVDPRSPFVLDTRELGRRPGSMRPVRRELAAPDGWSLELVAVSPGAPVELDLRLEAVVEGVLVTGVVRAPVTAECGRCLSPTGDELEGDIQELFAYAPEQQQDGDDPLPALDGDFLDLEPVLRDAVVLSLPLNPVCEPDCSGLCAGCGERLAALPAGHSHDVTDPRWATLADLVPLAGATASRPTPTDPTDPEES
jgi:uncharacterized protein